MATLSSLHRAVVGTIRPNAEAADARREPWGHLRIERPLLRNGHKPFKQYEALRDNGVRKTDILAMPNALAAHSSSRSFRCQATFNFEVES